MQQVTSCCTLTFRKVRYPNREAEGEYMTRPIEIAVIVAGIDEEYQNSIIEGIISCAKENNVNISCFAAFGGVISNRKFDLGEYNIYNLINYNKLDGVILLTNTISDPVEKEKIIHRVKASKLPAVVLDDDDDPEFYNIKIDNISAMRGIVSHIIEKHGAEKINYISGPMTNPEAEDRYNAFINEMTEHDLTVDIRRVFFGEFRSVDGRRAVESFLSFDMPKPDAIICANDAMALATIDELSKYGYKVPDDIIVTGFDNTFNARHHYPALTTVDRPLDAAGYKACEVLLKVINGDSVDKTCSLSAEPVFSGSCGCRTDADEDIISYKKEVFRLISDCRTDISILNRLTTDLAENEDMDTNINDIAKYISELKFERFCVCLCSNWDEAFRDGWKMNSSIREQVEGYTEEMIAPLIFDNGKRLSVDKYKSSEMYPYRDGNGGNVRYFLPLHFREVCLGYYIITNSTFPIKSMVCHSIMLNISQSIENIRKLLNLNSMIRELDKLYVNDPLCNIFNRNGFIRAADNIFSRCKIHSEKLLISFIDMDGLKIINDNYGHKEGDFALQKLASIISSCCNEDRICARFGGDEFIILGSNASQDDIAKLENEFKEKIDSVNKVINKPYELSASIGTIVSEVTPNLLLFTLITQADEIMYERKKKKATSRYLRHE